MIKNVFDGLDALSNFGEGKEGGELSQEQTP